MQFRVNFFEALAVAHAHTTYTHSETRKQIQTQL